MMASSTKINWDDLYENPPAFRNTKPTDDSMSVQRLKQQTKRTKKLQEKFEMKQIKREMRQAKMFS